MASTTVLGARRDVRCAPVESRTHNEVGRDCASVRPLDFRGEFAGVAHLGDIGAVGVVRRIVEMILYKAAFGAAFRRLDDPWQNELSGHGVEDGGNQRPILVFVRKHRVKQDDVAGDIQDVEIHGTVSPRPVRVPQGDPEFRAGGYIAGTQKFQHEISSLRDEGFQALPVRHVFGSDGWVAMIDLFFNHMRFVEIESHEQHNRRPQIGRDVDGGVARSARYTR